VTSFKELYEVGGQSPWLDNVRRDWLQDGTMARFVDEGIRGVTSNPTIFAKAISATDQYDAQLASLGDVSFEDAFVTIASKDITDTAKLLQPVHDASDGADGFVSFEVAPTLAYDTDGTIEAGRKIATSLALPNLLVKVPATEAGLPAISALLAEGVSVNVTLIFGLGRYAQVVDAYLEGLERALAAGRDLRSITSVASFFVSRVDTEIDGRLDELGADAALKGRAAVAQAKCAYELFTARFAESRFGALEANGAHVQRPLWASTSTKNPSYSDLLYVDSLIGQKTVNTMPDETVEAFLDHGVVRRTVDDDVDAAHRTISEVEAAGVSMEDVAKVLEDKGVRSFAQSFHDLLETIEDKRARS
jgi:transaldolase